MVKGPIVIKKPTLKRGFSANIGLFIIILISINTYTNSVKIISIDSHIQESEQDIVEKGSIEYFEERGILYKSYVEDFAPGEIIPSIENNVESGIAWEEEEILDSPYAPVNPSLAVDSDNNLHICWSNYYNGRSLYHMIRYSNGTWNEKEVVINYSSGEEIGLDIAADNLGRIHLAYSWGASYDAQKSYYRVWDEGQWSDSERIDYGEDEVGNSLPAHHPIIAIDSTGKPHVLWSGEYLAHIGYGYNHPVYYQKRIGENEWSNVLYAGNARSNAYDMIISKNDIIHVSFSITVGGFYDAYHSLIHTRKGINDLEWLQVDELLYYSIPGSVQYAPKAPLVEVGNNIHCYSYIISDYNQLIIELVSGGVLWDDPTLVTSELNFGGSIAMDAACINNSDIVLIYSDFGIEDFVSKGKLYFQIYYKNLESWSTPDAVYDNYTYVNYPELVSDNFDNVHAIWRDNHPVSGQALYYSNGLYDQDFDGLSNYDEIHIYGTLPNDNDTDNDLLNDGDEITLGLDPIDSDQDSDLILDGWEINFGFNPLFAGDASFDNDTDALTTLEEFLANTQPFNNDTDNDLLDDGAEVNTHLTDPTNSDSDFDNLLDGDEILTFGTNALNNDTEGDGMPDGFEVSYSLDPLIDDSSFDNDSDILTNIQEFQYGTNPISNDTDIDKLSDYEEIMTYFTDPCNNDSDYDLLTDYYELTIDPLDNTFQTPNIYITNPLVIDTDLDSLSDLTEINQTLTNPLTNDTDGDLMYDGYECYFGLNPFIDDSGYDNDSDTLTNYIESTYNSNPFSLDTDGDRLYDNEEVLQYKTDPTLEDTDGDWITDYFEVLFTLTNASNPDTDYDGLNDYYEFVVYGSNPFVNDTDSDGLTDGDEVFLYNSSPNLIDTDGDRLNDFLEVEFNSAPYLFDTEGDGMGDYWEWQYGFDPRVDDSYNDEDGDGLTNLEEYQFFSNPYLTDTDGDNLDDYVEVYIHLTYPFSNDTDDDSLTDFDEIEIYSTSPHDPDCDDDGLTDGEEILQFSTDPQKFDTDGDGFSDFQEIEVGTDPLNAKSNPNRTTTILIISIFGGIVFVMLLYYIFPVILSFFSGKKETQWIKIGVRKREKKSKEILDKIGSNPESKIEE